MTIVKIQKEENGSHDNQTWDSGLPIPSGYAVVPDGMETPNFPFGDITESGGMVTSWNALVVPKPAPAPPTPMDIIMAQVVHSAIKSGSLLPSMKEVMGRG